MTEKNFEPIIITFACNWCACAGMEPGYLCLGPITKIWLRVEVKND